MFPTGKIEGQNPTCTAVFGHLSGVILIHSSPLGWNLSTLHPGKSEVI
jgi:hypothetical protein